MGGMSGEHEVSLVSAKSVIESLDKNKYEVIPIEISKNGLWPEDLMILPEPAQKVFDVIIPVMHGSYGEDGKIQGLLETANLAYVGCGVLGSAICMDKIIAKQLFKSAGIATPEFIGFNSTDWQKAQAALLKQIQDELKYPLFVKPANLGSSVGISKVLKQEDLIKAIELALSFDRRVIVERSIEESIEVECSVLGNDRPEASLPGRVIPADTFYSYRDKYIDNKTKFEIPVKLPPDKIDEIRQTAVKIFKLMDLSGLARVDFLVNGQNQIYLNEINTMPGFTKISMYPKLWAKSGLPYEKLLDKLIELALERQRQKNSLKTSYEEGEKINV